MPELRRDPIVGRWVVLAPERGERPSDFPPVHAGTAGNTCPFCPGHESMTPPEVYAERPDGMPDNGEGWSVRVVSNKYPALQIEGDLDPQSDGVYRSMRGVGAHEVIIESPDHRATLASLPDDQIAAVARAARERIIDLTGDRRFRYIQVFKNFGAEAGATLEHSHTQLIATPTVPRRLDEELGGFALHERANGGCILCAMIQQERNTVRRILCESERFLAFEPFAPRFPYETWIVPTYHEGAYETSSDEDLLAFGQILGKTLRAIHRALGSPPYNFVLHTAPINEPGRVPLFHWHLEIMPKLTKVAGFEWGTGFYINSVPPEDAADVLRGHLDA
ncbi:MAG: DUF4921 family protein [Candidatus Eisenbacteria bacterium]